MEPTWVGLRSIVRVAGSEMKGKASDAKEIDGAAQFLITES